VNILLVYNQIPENLDFYLMPESDLTEEDRKILEAINGEYVNIDEYTQEMKKADNALATKPEYTTKDCEEDWKCRWAKFKTECPITAPISKVYEFGMVM
jgi:hypothetical protein